MTDAEQRVRDSFDRLTLMRTIGARLLRVAPGEVDVDMPFREDLTQHHGFLAAAVLTAIVDVACGYAAMTLLSSDMTVLTVEYKVNFLAPARGERMIARSRVVRSGRTVSVCAGDVFAEVDGEEKLVATILATIIGVRADARLPSPEASAARQDRHGGSTRHTRPWCVCGGRGLGPRLRDLSSFARRRA
jgi:uncharacterized protein (TIGR00369 family)